MPTAAQGQALTPNSAEWNLINLTPKLIAEANGGLGVEVAVMDGLTDCRHAEFGPAPQHCENNTISGGRYRFYSNHGTHVAGTIAGKTHGVAPKAHIHNYAVFDDRGYVATGDALIKAWQNAAAKGATITNMSFGCTKLALCFTAAELAAMASAELSSMLFIKAAGNDGANLSTESIAVSGDVARAAMAQLMLVGSVNLSGSISSFSNRPGETCLLPNGAAGCSEDLKWKYYFIVAPGENIYAALPGGKYGYMSGTSMASPIVAGVAALLRGRWPTLSPEDTALILFSTARDLGAPGVDSVYGWGLLNVGNAFSAQGTVTVQRTSGGTITVSGTSLTSSPTLSGLEKALGVVTVYDKFDRDFALGQTGALQVRPATYAWRQGLGRRLLGQGTQADWASSLFAPERTPYGFFVYGSPGEIAANPVMSDRDARIGLDIPFKGGIAQLRITGSSAARADLANDPSLKSLSFFASSALLDRSLLGHALVRLSDSSSLSFYVAKSTDPISPYEHPGATPDSFTERELHQLSFGVSREEQRKRTLGAGYWARPDSRTVVGLNASVIEQKGGWYDLSLTVPSGGTSTRITNLGAVASRLFGAWEVTVSGEISQLKSASDGVFQFTPARIVAAEASIQRRGLLFDGATRDNLALAVVLPPRAVSGSLELDHMTRTPDGLGRQPVEYRYSLAKMAGDSPRVEASYRISGDKNWLVGLAAGVGLNGKIEAGELLASLRVRL